MALAPTPSSRATPLPAEGAEDFTVQISFPARVREEAVTGRVFAIFTRDDGLQPVMQVGPTGVPVFGENIDALGPDEAAVIDKTVLGFPVASIADLPAGEYVVQAFVNIYTLFPRADGHTVWLHMDQWEGQDWQRSPGNLYSLPRRVYVNPAEGGTIEIECDRVIPPITVPPDSTSVKRFKFKSEILSAWWGRDIFLGATVLLPRGYDEFVDVNYPVHYVQGHFSLWPPEGFGTGGEFDRYWLAEGTPRFVMVSFQHPTPYYDDSYCVNSENNGPYGDAIMEELIPAVEERFRTIREPWGRVLSGRSTGGWSALALQVHNPEFFGGCWAISPDPVDFRYLQLVNIYSDENAYWREHEWFRVERPSYRDGDGNIDFSMRDENYYELVMGDRSRSGSQWDIWEATFSPVGADGYPRRIWDKRTGQINADVAKVWKTNHDLRHILESRWSEIGHSLAGKIHVSVGDMDNYYLNEAVHCLEDFLETTTSPPYGGTFSYGRTGDHGWGPTGIELQEMITAHVLEVAPPGADISSWRHY